MKGTFQDGLGAVFKLTAETISSIFTPNV